MTNEKRTAGELLFERYLVMNGYLNFEFEKPVVGSTNVPDYSLNVDGFECFLDVKDFEPDREIGAGGGYNPHERIRKKIQKLQEKFKDDIFESHCCIGVLCSPALLSKLAFLRARAHG